MDNCYQWLLQVADHFRESGLADACVKCATGPCTIEPAI